MRQPLRANAQRRQVSVVVGQPAPVRGWNVRDRLEAVDPPDYASIMDNWVPEAGRAMLRRGFQTHATGLGARVDTFLPFSAGGTARLFAAAGNAIYDVTASGGVGSAAVSSLTNNRWVSTMFATSGGNFLVAVNGADGVRTYNGSTWATQTITGVTASTLVGVGAHRARLWFIRSNTLSAYYLPALAISGEATEFPLAGLCRAGGTLLAVATWTRDGGSGPGDLIAFITTAGEVLVYDGTDPSSADSFGLVGIFKIDRPLGRYCATKYGGDLLILTRSGIVSMNALLPGYGEPERTTISELIRPAILEAATAAPAAWGWSISTYGARGWVIVNVPIREPAIYVQFVFNALSGAWWRATNMNGICWQELSGRLFFGDQNGTTFEADIGGRDAGQPIPTDLMCAFSRYGTSSQKKFTMVRPFFTTNSVPRPAINMRVDFDLSAPTSQPQLTERLPGTPWGSPWGSPWGISSRNSTQWVGATGIGHIGAIRMTLDADNIDLSLSGFDVMFEPGGAI